MFLKRPPGTPSTIQGNGNDFLKWGSCMVESRVSAGVLDNNGSWFLFNPRGLLFISGWSWFSLTMGMLWTVFEIIVAVAQTCYCCVNITVSRVAYSQIARFMGPTWGPPGDDSTQVGPMNLCYQGWFYLSIGAQQVEFQRWHNIYSLISITIGRTLVRINIHKMFHSLQLIAKFINFALCVLVAIFRT